MKSTARSARPFALLVAGLLVPALAACGAAPAVDGVGFPPDVAVAAYDADRRELVIELDPVDLPAPAGHGHHGAGHGGGHGAMPEPLREVVVPADGWLLGYDVEVVDAEGEPVSKQVVHHVNVMAPERRELFSPIMQRIGAMGAETDPVDLPPFLGYPVSRGDRVLVKAMLHDPTGAGYQGVRLRMRLPFVARDWRPRKAVFPFYVDVMPPAGIHAYDLPPGRSEMSWEGSPAVAGRILGVGGHLHRHALRLRFEDVTDGRVLWDARPDLDDAGEITGMPRKFFWSSLGEPVRPDHVYRLTAFYDNPTGAAIPDGAMGTLGGIFVPDRADAWPPVDPDDAQYLEDLAIQYGTPAPDPTAGARPDDAGGHDHGEAPEPDAPTAGHEGH